MAANRGRYEVTCRIPGEKRVKKHKLATDREIAELALKYPVGTEVWVMVPLLNIGYGMTVKGKGLMY